MPGKTHVESINGLGIHPHVVLSSPNGFWAEFMGEFPREIEFVEHGSLYTSLFGERRIVDCDVSLSPSKPRNVDQTTLAEVDGGGVQVRLRDCGAKVELVSRQTELEAANHISSQMNRDDATLGGSRTVDRTRPTQLVAVSLRRDEADQFENAPHGNLLSDCFEIDTRQERFSSERFPPMIAFGRIEKRGAGTEKRNRYAFSVA
jgi:hypothetical protein